MSLKISNAGLTAEVELLRSALEKTRSILISEFGNLVYEVNFNYLEVILKQSQQEARKCGLCYPGNPCNFENCPDDLAEQAQQETKDGPGPAGSRTAGGSDQNAGCESRQGHAPTTVQDTPANLYESPEKLLIKWANRGTIPRDVPQSNILEVLRDMGTFAEHCFAAGRKREQSAQNTADLERDTELRKAGHKLRPEGQ